MSISFQNIYPEARGIAWLSIPFSGFSLDSRTTSVGQIFLALNSYSQPEKTRLFAQHALSSGAIGVISEHVLGVDNEWVCPDVRLHIGQWQRAYLQAIDPIQLPRVFAVTGTNGKTTISRLIAELLHLQNQRCALFGTTGNGILPQLDPSTHTTLDALQLQTCLHSYAKVGARFASLEASSHGIEQGRLNGCEIEIAIYSNLSRDHLDYHGTLQAYAEAKARLFSFEKLKFVVINLDDAYAEQMLSSAKNNPSQPKIITYALKDTRADYFVHSVTYRLDQTTIHLDTPHGSFKIKSPFLGQFNVENLIASLIAVELAGFDFSEIIKTVPQLQGAPGRMQVIADHDRIFIVDYAHTPDALAQVLKTLKHHVQNRVWAVFGCGGDRDRGKRPLMVRAALEGANPIILTSDNPRTENLEQIFADMRESVDFSSHDVFEIWDRREAIKFAINHAENGDIVVIAGKGHENYQEIDGVRHWFDDAVEVRSLIDAQKCLINLDYPAE